MREAYKAARFLSRNIDKMDCLPAYKQTRNCIIPRPPITARWVVDLREIRLNLRFIFVLYPLIFIL